MTKSELIESLSYKLDRFSQKDIEQAVNTMLDTMIHTLAQGNRIEIRGFGSFTLHERKARMGRNPKTGEQVPLPAKRVPHFKPGKALREKVNASREHTDIIR
ncbi:integration host factor subunit beta [Sulfurivirga caldicuralii]|uniref:Integration host factor subunit beta n=1 Tax=Sulfurivirga caldicuralii TaxID=364032 RepID=A0A1N6FC46_9GAMM|nr:integration host factor subunit beta [Sulfurivirga caldicuralii]SIN92794.1 integration host factor subunit beta [Sulfurivirga caldicuralii]